MPAQNITPPRRQRLQEEPVSALAYWGTGAAGLAFLVFIFWVAGMSF